MLDHQDLRWKSLCSSCRIIESSVAWTTTLSCEYQLLVLNIQWFVACRCVLLVVLCNIFNPLVEFLLDTSRFAELGTHFYDLGIFSWDNVLISYILLSTVLVLCLRVLGEMAQGNTHPALLSVGKRRSVVAFRIIAALLHTLVATPLAHVVIPALLWRFESFWHVAIPVPLLEMLQIVCRWSRPKKHHLLQALIRWVVACLLCFGGQLLLFLFPFAVIRWASFAIWLWARCAWTSYFLNATAGSSPLERFATYRALSSAQNLPSDGAQHNQNRRAIPWFSKLMQERWLCQFAEECAIDLFEGVAYLAKDSLVTCFLLRFELKLTLIATSFAISMICSRQR